MDSLMDPRAGLDDMEKLKFLTYRDSNPNPSIALPVASRYTDYATAAHSLTYLAGKGNHELTIYESDRKENYVKTDVIKADCGHVNCSMSNLLDF
jgi:hypothetical protein